MRSNGALMTMRLFALAALSAVFGAACAGGDAGTPPATPSQQHLSILASGTGAGTVTSQPPGIACAVSSGTVSPTGCATDLDEGTQGTLIATAESGSIFSGWNGGGCSSTGACFFTMDQALAIRAAFARVGFGLVLGGSGTGSGSVTSMPAGLNCTVSAGVALGSGCAATLDGDVQLTASPAPASAFAGWGGDCSGIGPCTVAMTQTRGVTASFTQVGFRLTVFGGGIADGTVSSGPAGISCVVTAGVAGETGCTADFDQGVQLMATPTPASVFAGWGGDCSGTGACILTMTQAKNVTAAFVPGTAPTIIVQSGLTSGASSNCPLPPVGPGSGWSSYVTRLYTYSDAEGDIKAGAVFRDFVTYYPSLDTLTLTLSNPTITGDGYNGTVSFEMCFNDDPSPTVTHSMRLVDAGGHASNALAFDTY